MKYKEIEKLPSSDLVKLLREKREELRRMRFKAANRQLGNVKMIRVVRKDIARIMTALKKHKHNSSVGEQK